MRDPAKLPKHRMTEVRSAPTSCAVCPIRQKALFQVVSEDYLQEAESRRTAQYRLPARSLLYQEGAPAAMAYTLYDGWLLLFRTHSDGSRQGLRVALPGDFVGYAPLAEADYSHGAIAVSDVVVCGFRQHDLHAMLDKHKDMARQVMSIQARDMANCEANLLGLGRKSAQQRIAHAVVDLYHRLDRLDLVDCTAHSMPFPLTQEMLGELTGLTPVHTNRVLRRLRGDGVLACARHRLDILDLPRLVELADYRASTGV